MASPATAKVLQRAPGAAPIANDNEPVGGRVAWYRNYHRYYDPGTGRYIQNDPLTTMGVAGLHPYSYAEGNPVVSTDPTGLEPLGWDWRLDHPGQNPYNWGPSGTPEEELFRALMGASIASLFAAAAIAAVPEVAPVAGRKLCQNIKIDGPSPGLAYGNGRIVQLRLGNTPLIRLDYHPLPGSVGPVLHLNLGSEGVHVKLWPWR